MSNLREASEYFLRCISFNFSFPLISLNSFLFSQALNPSELEFQELKQAFDEFDKVITIWYIDIIKDEQDSSGTISTVELLHVLRAMGQNPTEDELLNLVMEVDMDGNGTIEFEEFLDMMKKKASEVDEEAELRYDF